MTFSLVPLPTPTADDIKYLEKCDGGVRFRNLVERAIVRKTAEALIAAGYEIRVHDGESFATKRTQDLPTIMEAVMSTEEDYLKCWKVGETGNASWVYFVYGNTGWDVMNDHTTDLEEVLKPVSDYADQMCEWF